MPYVDHPGVGLRLLIENGSREDVVLDQRGKGGRELVRRADSDWGWPAV